MKKIIFRKKRQTFESDTERREKIAIFICLPIILVSLLICSVILLQPIKEATPVVVQETSLDSEDTEKYTYPPSSPNSLSFQSLGNETCTVAGIGNFSGNELKIPEISPAGEAVTAINPNAFSGCETLELVKIPQTVTIIGENAFRNCKALVAIEVDMDNEYYSSVGGVLFSKDKNLLICYPQSKPSDKYYLNPNVKFIENYAFENVKNLSSILYSKSDEDFGKISVGLGNDSLSAISVSCDYKGGNNSK